MPTARLQYFSIDVLENLIAALKNKLIPDMPLHDDAGFELLAPDILEYLRIFFLNFIDADNLEYIMSNAPQSIKNDISVQLSNCRLLCKSARETGLCELAVPEDVSLFLSVIPAELVLQLNVQRFEKGIRPTENDAIEYGGKFFDIH